MGPPRLTRVNRRDFRESFSEITNSGFTVWWLNLFSLKPFFFLSMRRFLEMKRESIYDRMTEAEKEVADLLKNLGIRWTYEHPVFVWDENKRPRVWAPDFFLVQFGIYVEVCGSEDFDYNYRRRIFNRNGHKVIFLHLYKEPIKWKKHLISYLWLFINHRNRKLDEILYSGVTNYR